MRSPTRPGSVGPDGGTVVRGRGRPGIGFALLALVLSGCAATVHRAREAQDPASAIPGERTPTAKELGLPPSGKVGLAPLVRAALAVHPSVVAARRAAEAAFARIRAAEGAMMPQVGVNASAAYRDQQKTSSAPVEHRFESFGFDVSWLIVDFGERSAITRQTAAQWLAAQQDLRTAEVETAFAVRNAYYELAKDVELLATAKETVKQYQDHLDQVVELERVGSRIAYDVTKARVDLGNAKLLEVKAADALLSARATLANAVGLAEALDWMPESPDTPLDVTFEPKDFDAAWAATLPSRPALAAAAAREQAAFALVDARVAALYPSVSLDFGWSRSGSKPPLPWSFNLGPSLRWTPFDGFQNLASIDESVATLKEARTARTAEEQAAWLDVKTAWIAIEDATKRVELENLLVASAEENLSLAQGRFDAGVGTSVDLSDARQSLVVALAGRIQARADRAIAVARLARAVGLSTSQP